MTHYTSVDFFDTQKLIIEKFIEKGTSTHVDPPGGSTYVATLPADTSHTIGFSVAGRQTTLFFATSTPSALPPIRQNNEQPNSNIKLPGDFNTNEDSVAGSKRFSQQPNSSSKRGGIFWW